jgi:surface protein
MFHDSNFNNSINSWDVSNATHMSGMFDNAVHFNQPLYNWNTSQVIDMGGMFAEAINFDQDITMWNVNKVKTMENMFRNAIKFSQNLSYGHLILLVSQMILIRVISLSCLNLKLLEVQFIYK